MLADKACRIWLVSIDANNNHLDMFIFILNCYHSFTWKKKIIPVNIPFLKFEKHSLFVKGFCKSS